MDAHPAAAAQSGLPQQHASGQLGPAAEYHDPEAPDPYLFQHGDVVNIFEDGSAGPTGIGIVETVVRELHRRWDGRCRTQMRYTVRLYDYNSGAPTNHMRWLTGRELTPHHMVQQQPANVQVANMHSGWQQQLEADHQAPTEQQRKVLQRALFELDEHRKRKANRNVAPGFTPGDMWVFKRMRGSRRPSRLSPLRSEHDLFLPEGGEVEYETDYDSDEGPEELEFDR